jgi:hypothetical protein
LKRHLEIGSVNMSAPTKLFDAFRLGPFALPDRVVMAWLTRNRAQPPGIVRGLLAAEYYRQRALNEWDTATFYGGGGEGIYRLPDFGSSTGNQVPSS